jgi:short-subunit dehydrogenase
VTLVARRRDALLRLAAELGPGQAHVAAADLSDPAQATAWLGDAEAALGPIDVLVNNAGVGSTGAFVDGVAADELGMLLTNVHAPALLARAVLPGMLARGGGSIVNVASVAGLVSVPLKSWYSATKAALGGFSEALHGELRGSGVHVLTVYPGPVKTPASDRTYAVLGGRKGLVGALPEGSAEGLARRIRRAVERRQARLIYPRVYALERWFPNLARGLLNAFGLRAPRR